MISSPAWSTEWVPGQSNTVLKSKQTNKARCELEKLGKGYSLVLEHLISVCRALGPIPRTTKNSNSPKP